MRNQYNLCKHNDLQTHCIDKTQQESRARETKNQNKKNNDLKKELNIRKLKEVRMFNNLFRYLLTRGTTQTHFPLLIHKKKRRKMQIMLLIFSTNFLAKFQTERSEMTNERKECREKRVSLPFFSIKSIEKGYPRWASSKSHHLISIFFGNIFGYMVSCPCPCPCPQVKNVCRSNFEMRVSKS